MTHLTWLFDIVPVSKNGMYRDAPSLSKSYVVFYLKHYYEHPWLPEHNYQLTIDESTGNILGCCPVSRASHV
jgi:hypothetical protein